MSRKQMLLLSIAYAANIGGTGVITGSPPNLVLPEKLKEAFGPVHPLSFFNWMLFAVPLMIVNLVLAFLWLSFYEWFDQRMQRRKDENSMKQARINEGYDGSTEVVGNGYCEQGRQTSIKDDLESLERDPEKERNIRQVIEEQYLALGGWKAQEVTIAICFTLLICLWFFRDPRVFPGWLALFHYKDVKIGDATMTVFMVLVVFSLPTHLRFWPFQPALHKAHRSQALLQWGGDKGVERRLQWGVILLLGGGFALSEGCETSGLSSWVGARLSGILTSPLLSSFLICLITTGITEFASNTATANVLIPILVNTSRQLCLNPIYLSLVCTISCSYAFMLPAATAPNAIVKGAANIKISDMMKVGFVMNLICVSTTVIMINTFGRLIFSFDTLPLWLTESDQVFAKCANVTNV